ncbi:DUF4229 domain-containing protein [Nocardioides sp. Bht2]|uniref:DUF4229 domain-containing protein n=1 Tax=Nocardioides sp. Bht2 TaxID=3392297 RepID=UPI0039B45ACA
MKEFVVYTLMRLGLLVGAFAVVVGVWSIFADDVPVLWAVVLAFLISGIASFFVLNPQRERFAAKVEGRAARAAARFEERRAKEDDDE